MKMKKPESMAVSEEELASVVGGAGGEENDACPNCGSKLAIFVSDEKGEHYRCMSCGTLRDA